MGLVAGEGLHVCYVYVTGTYWTNPQFQMDVPADDVDSEGQTTVIIGLRLLPSLKLKNRDRQRISIGYDIYPVSFYRYRL